MTTAFSLLALVSLLAALPLRAMPGGTDRHPVERQAMRLVKGEHNPHSGPGLARILLPDLRGRARRTMDVGPRACTKAAAMPARWSATAACTLGE
ncbi:MAG: hypothetical protein KC518_14290 [Candidatus Cloacimonetes bacterium]|nr:hypothetical protein [Candidatus Cloacimonadota bacterium]